MHQTRRAPVPAPLAAHLNTSYGPTRTSSTPGPKPKRPITEAQLRQRVLNGVAYLEEHGWHPDAQDLQTYGPGLHGFTQAKITEIATALVATDDLVSTMRVPQNCRLARLCYRIPTFMGEV